MKKCVVWMLLALVLAGCGRQPAVQAAQLDIWVTSPERGAVYEALAESWNQENPQEPIQVAVTVYSSQSIAGKFSRGFSVSAGYGDSGIPDLVELDYAAFPEFVFQQTADLYPLQNLLNKHGSTPAGKEIYSKNGICFALPYRNQELVLCYRLELEMDPAFRRSIASFEGLKSYAGDKGEPLLWVDYLGSEVFLSLYAQAAEKDPEGAYDRTVAFLKEGQEEGTLDMLPSGDAYSDSFAGLLAEGAVPCFVTTRARLESLGWQEPGITELYGAAGLPSFAGSSCRVDAPTVAVAVPMSGSDPVLSRDFLEYCRFSEAARAYPEFYLGEDPAEALSDSFRVLGSLDREPGQMKLTAMELSPYLAEYSREVLDVLPE